MDAMDGLVEIIESKGYFSKIYVASPTAGIGALSQGQEAPYEWPELRMFGRGGLIEDYGDFFLVYAANQRMAIFSHLFYDRQGSPIQRPEVSVEVPGEWMARERGPLIVSTGKRRTLQDLPIAYLDPFPIAEALVRSYGRSGPVNLLRAEEAFGGTDRGRVKTTMEGVEYLYRFLSRLLEDRDAYRKQIEDGGAGYVEEANTQAIKNLLFSQYLLSLFKSIGERNRALGERPDFGLEVSDEIKVGGMLGYTSSYMYEEVVEPAMRYLERNKGGFLAGIKEVAREVERELVSRGGLVVGVASLGSNLQVEQDKDVLLVYNSIYVPGSVIMDPISSGRYERDTIAEAVLQHSGMSLENVFEAEEARLLVLPLPGPSSKEHWESGSPFFVFVLIPVYLVRKREFTMSRIVAAYMKRGSGGSAEVDLMMRKLGKPGTGFPVVSVSGYVKNENLRRVGTTAIPEGEESSAYSINIYREENGKGMLARYSCEGRGYLDRCGVVLHRAMSRIHRDELAFRRGVDGANARTGENSDGPRFDLPLLRYVHLLSSMSLCLPTGGKGKRPVEEIAVSQGWVKNLSEILIAISSRWSKRHVKEIEQALWEIVRGEHGEERKERLLELICDGILRLRVQAHTKTSLVAEGGSGENKKDTIVYYTKVDILEDSGLYVLSDGEIEAWVPIV